MRIGIDGRVLEKRMTGIGRYLLNILDELPHYDNTNSYFIFTNNKQNHLTSPFYSYITFNYPLISSKLFTPFWLNNVLPNVIKKYNIDLWIGPNILVPLKKIDSAKMVSIVHDIMPLTHSQFFPLSYRIFLKRYLGRSLSNSDLVITISNTSKQEIVNYFNLSEDKIKVVYNTFSRKFRKLNEEELNQLQSKIKLNLPQKFLLYVGVLEKRKNIDLLINLIDQLNEKINDFSLVIAGKPGFGYKDFKDKLKIRSGKIMILNSVDDDILLFLYNKAFAFVFPSFVEGFGLPPLEAMACGLPVLASNCNALKEVLDDVALLHDPMDKEAFTNSVMRLYEDSSFYYERVKLSLAHSKNFNQEKMIKSFIDVINSIYGKS